MENSNQIVFKYCPEIKAISYLVRACYQPLIHIFYTSNTQSPWDEIVGKNLLTSLISFNIATLLAGVLFYTTGKLPAWRSANTHTEKQN